MRASASFAQTCARGKSKHSACDRRTLEKLSPFHGNSLSVHSATVRWTYTDVE